MEVELKEKLYRTREAIKEKLERLNDSTSSSQIDSREADVRRRELNALERAIEENNTQIDSERHLPVSQLLTPPNLSF